jgi:hypothetical protein
MYIRKGHTIVENGLVFTFLGDKIQVDGQVTRNVVGYISTLNQVGLPAVGTEQDMQELISWWLFENGGL